MDTSNQTVPSIQVCDEQKKNANVYYFVVAGIWLGSIIFSFVLMDSLKSLPLLLVVTLGVFMVGFTTCFYCVAHLRWAVLGNNARLHETLRQQSDSSVSKPGIVT